MPTIYGLYGNQVLPQPPFTVSRNDQGGVTASQSYYVRTEAVNANYFAKGKSLLQIDPDGDDKYYFLTVVSWEITQEEGDVSLVKVNYTGSAFATYGENELSSDADPVYRLSGTLVDTPLSEHPKWKALDKSIQAVLSYILNGNYIWDIDEQRLVIQSDDGTLAAFTALSTDISTSTDAVKFANRIASGITTYPRPSLTWNETAQGNDQLTAAQLNKLGKIATPRGNPPAPTGGRDWMLVNASQEQSGELFQTSLEWQLSEAGGHDSFLFDD